MLARDFFAKEWSDYTAVTPLAKKIHDLFLGLGENVLNDHIALRTLAHPSLGLEAMQSFFGEMGYSVCGEYHFEQKKLRAVHLEAKDLPLVFISEFLYEDDSFSEALKEVMEDLVASCDGSSLDELFYMRRPWSPSYSVYQSLARESEYAAWLYAWGFRVNHFTVAVHELKKLQTIEAVNEFLKSHQIQLNASGGEIKGLPSQGLVQSSTLASSARVTFLEGEKEIPSCYYEFAKRYAIHGELYRGFIPASADKIFESTDQAQS